MADLRTRCWRSITAFLIIFAMTSANPSRAQDPLGLTLGGILAQLANKVDTMVQEAIGGGLTLEIQAGGQLAGLIQQAQAAYSADLDLTLDRISTQEKQTLDDIESLTDEFQQNASASARDIMGKSQQVANTLPLAGLFPQLTSYSPLYTVPSTGVTDTSVVELKVEGNFADLYRRKLDATAVVGKNSYLNSIKTTQLLTFRIPVNDLNRPRADDVVPNKIDILIPYVGQHVIDLHSPPMTAKFSVGVGTLPRQLGSITITTSCTVASTKSKDFTTQEFQQEFGDDDIKCGGEHADQAIHSQLADPGWAIIWLIARPISIGLKGKRVSSGSVHLNNCTTQLAACLCVSTEHHRFGTSGKVHFKIFYTAQMPTTEIHSSTHEHRASLESSRRVGHGAERQLVVGCELI